MAASHVRGHPVCPVRLSVLQDQKRAEKVSKRVNAIQEVNESVALLTQLLQDYDGTAGDQSNAELVQVNRTSQKPVCTQRLRDIARNRLTTQPPRYSVLTVVCLV